MLKTALGWTGIALCTLISSFWGFWGAIEGFHEGWFRGSLLLNGASVLTYLLPGLLIAALGVISVHFPRLGAGLFCLLGILVTAWVLAGNFRVTGRNWPIPVCFALIPILLGALLLRGDPHPRQLAAWVVGGVPLLVMLVSGFSIGSRALQRVDDGNRGMRAVAGDGVTLTWAGAGPGWDRRGGVSWEEATRRCDHLSEDGKTLAKTPQHFWRLPTADEAIRSMALHGRNSGGRWDAGTGKATFSIRPDKETPLWDPTSEVTYYWTSTEVDSARAYWVVYDGGVFAKPKGHSPGNVGFRAVRKAL